MPRRIEFLILFLIGGCTGPGHHMLMKQLRGADQGTILSLQGYIIDDGAELKRRWDAVAAAMRKQPGFLSARLSAGVGKSPMWLAHSQWRSIDDLKAGFSDPSVLDAESRMPNAAFEHLFLRGSEGSVESSSIAQIHRSNE